MNEIKLAVRGILCNACQRAIERALRPLRGVDDVAVDLAARTVRVAYEDPATPAGLRQAIEEQGYDVASMR